MFKIVDMGTGLVIATVTWDTAPVWFAENKRKIVGMLEDAFLVE